MRVKPKKRLGQNFLIDKNIRQKIVDSCGLSASDTVLEIGSGRGEITAMLAGKAGSVYAVEIDRSLLEILKTNLSGLHNVELIRDDILRLDLKKLFAKSRGNIKVIGNIPYYITTPIIERLLEFRENISAIFIMVQKEFALRAAAVPGSKSFGSLSCFLQYYAEPKVLFTIGRRCFYPAPKVDSCFLELSIRKSPAVEVRDEALFLGIIRAAFNKRRKTLRNSLEGTLPQHKLDAFFARYGIDRNIRPECLSLAAFANLANI